MRWQAAGALWRPPASRAVGSNEWGEYCREESLDAAYSGPRWLKPVQVTAGRRLVVALVGPALKTARGPQRPAHITCRGPLLLALTHHGAILARLPPPVPRAMVRGAREHDRRKPSLLLPPPPHPNPLPGGEERGRKRRCLHSLPFRPTGREESTCRRHLRPLSALPRGERDRERWVCCLDVPRRPSSPRLP